MRFPERCARFPLLKYGPWHLEYAPSEWSNGKKRVRSQKWPLGRPGRRERASDPWQATCGERVNNRKQSAENDLRQTFRRKQSEENDMCFVFDETFSGKHSAPALQHSGARALWCPVTRAPHYPATPALHYPGRPPPRHPRTPPSQHPTTPALRRPSTPAPHCPGTPPYRHPGAPLPRQLCCPDTPVLRCSGVPLHRHSGAPLLWHPG